MIGMDKQLKDFLKNTIFDENDFNEEDNTKSSQMIKSIYNKQKNDKSYLRNNFTHYNKNSI